MSAKPHTCEICSYRSEYVGQDQQNYHYKCPNCSTTGTEPR